MMSAQYFTEMYQLFVRWAAPLSHPLSACLSLGVSSSTGWHIGFTETLWRLQRPCLLISTEWQGAPPPIRYASMSYLHLIHREQWDQIRSDQTVTVTKIGDSLFLSSPLTCFHDNLMSLPAAVSVTSTVFLFYCHRWTAVCVCVCVQWSADNQGEAAGDVHWCHLQPRDHEKCHRRILLPPPRCVYTSGKPLI